MLRSLVRALLTPRETGPCIPQPAPFVDLSLATLVQQAGETRLLQSSGNRIVISDLIVQAQGSNTFQIMAGNRAITPVLTFVADQPASFGDIVLRWPEYCSIICGNSTPMAVSLRYRVYR